MKKHMYLPFDHYEQELQKQRREDRICLAVVVFAVSYFAYGILEWWMR